MRVLLTGANGFLGRYVLRSLQERGIDTVTVGRGPAAPGGFHLQADLLTDDLEAVVAESRATHLLHLAWYLEHGKFWTSPVNLRWLDMTVRLVQAFCHAGGQKVVGVGTAFEYARTDAPMREDETPLAPETFYGVVKDCTRRLTSAICAQHRVSWAWGRVFLPYGAGEDEKRLVPSLVAVFRGAAKPFGVNKTARRDFLHASDVAEGLAALLHARAEGVFNVCSGEGPEIEKLVRELAGLMGADPAPILSLATARPGEPAAVVGDNARLAALPWKPRLSLTAGLQRTLTDIDVANTAKRVNA